MDEMGLLYLPAKTLLRIALRHTCDATKRHGCSAVRFIIIQIWLRARNWLLIGSS